MKDLSSFKICPDYKRESFDFCEIQRDKNNVIVKNGELLYPYLLPSSHGSSYTLKLSDNLFFKRKQQDGNLPATIFSQHHFRRDYAELSGSLDDLAEVICYYLSKDMIDPKTQMPLIKVANYKLASYTDEEGVEFRGCVTENIVGENEELINMADIMKNSQGLDGKTDKTFESYSRSIQKYIRLKNIKCDFESLTQSMIKNSYFCWKVANSDNHKNNITFLLRHNQNGEKELLVSPLIDNGSAYELSAPYVAASDINNPRFVKLLDFPDFSKTDSNGNKFLDFSYYPFMHNAFMFDTDNINAEITMIGDKSYSYEYGLAAKMLSDDELLRQIYQIENQIDIEKMFSAIESEYGTATGFNWPPLLKEFILATNKVKSQTLSYVTADLYFQNAIKICEQSPKLVELKNEFLRLPLQQAKDDYNKLFIELCESNGIRVDKNKLGNLSVYKNEQQNQMQ